MPGYSTVKDTIFTGRTGRELRRHPPEVRELQFWLTCGPDRDPFGIFICEPESVAPRIGRSVRSLRKSLDTLVALDFCAWDADSQWIWVKEMAHHQFQTPLKAVDHRCSTARKWYAGCLQNPFLGPWFDRYVLDFYLEQDPHAVVRRGPPLKESPSKGASRGASKPLVMSDLSGDLDLSKEGSVSPQLVELVPDPHAPLAGDELEEAFSRLWDAYPNAVERKAARAMFARAKPTHALVGEMLAAVELQKVSKNWQSGFIPKLTNWIEKQRWLDRLDEQPVLTERNARTQTALQRFVNRRQAHRES